MQKSFSPILVYIKQFVWRKTRDRATPCTGNPERNHSWQESSWVFEAGLKNFFGSLDHDWLLKFVEHRIGDPRIIQLIKRWLKAGVVEEGKFQASEVGTPQGASISVLLSKLYLHYVLDLWFEKVIKPNLKGEAYLIR